MRTPSSETLNMLRSSFPEGVRVRLLRMEDPQSPPPGTEGTVIGVDDIGTVHVAWDNGSTLGAVYGIDELEIIMK